MPDSGVRPRLVPATFRQTRARRLGNVLITPLVRLGLAGKRTHILTVPGRRSGCRYSTPVQLIIDDSGRWLVAPYGEREWVKNARAAGAVELTRAGRTARYAAKNGRTIGVVRKYSHRIEEAAAA